MKRTQAEYGQCLQVFLLIISSIWEKVSYDHWEIGQKARYMVILYQFIRKYDVANPLTIMVK